MGEQLLGSNAQHGFGRSLASLTSSSSLAAASLLAIPPASPWATTTIKTHRTIARAPVHILDAPEMLEDYYLNLLDWSRTNTVGVALNKAVYLWQAATGKRIRRKTRNKRDD